MVGLPSATWRAVVRAESHHRLCYHLPIPQPAPPAKEEALALKLPKVQLGPRPRKWDLIAAAVLLLAVALAAASWLAARAQAPGVSPSSGFTTLVALAQLAICTLSVLLLGKTAQEGTLWGNLAAVGGMFAGLSGVLLAAALWVAA